MKDNEKITVRRAGALAIVLGGGMALALILQGLLSYINPKPAPEPMSPFETASFEAHAIYVYDVKNSAVLYAKNENEKLPLASVTKIMTAFVARENFSRDAILKITPEDISTEGDSGLHVGERWQIGDLINVMLIISSNDAAHAISRFVGSLMEPGADPVVSHRNFVKMMNEKAASLGLAQMEFFNESGLDIEPVAPDQNLRNGGYGSAENVARLLYELWKKYPDSVEVSSHKDARIFSEDRIAHILPNTNEIVGQIPGLIASKTGFTDIAGGNLAVIFDRGMGDPIIAVVLGSSYAGRFEDMKKIVAITRGNDNFLQK